MLYQIEHEDDYVIIPGVVDSSGNPIKWAKGNLTYKGGKLCIGNPQEYGYMFQWGNTKTGYPPSGAFNINQYGEQMPYIPNWTLNDIPSELKYQGNKEYDIAAVYGNGWRTPTNADLISLFDKTVGYGSLNGINGVFFGERNVERGLFLPVGGYRGYNMNGPVTTGGGYYWTSSNSGNGKAYYGSVSESSIIHSRQDPYHYCYQVRMCKI